MSKLEVENIYPLSPMQYGMLFHSVEQEGSSVYVQHVPLLLRGRVDPIILQEAWRYLVNRHATLRGSFHWDGKGRPLRLWSIRWSCLGRSGTGGATPWRNRRSCWRSFSSRIVVAGSTSTCPPLMRLALIRVADEQWQFIWTHHHILLDGWSVAILMEEISVIYDALLSRSRPNLPPVPEYAHYIQWMQQQDLRKAEMYWRNYLADFVTPTDLRISEASNDEGPSSVRHDTFDFGSELTRLIASAAKTNKVTTNTMILLAWSILLARYSGETDVIFGATTAGQACIDRRRQPNGRPVYQYSSRSGTR